MIKLLRKAPPEPLQPYPGSYHVRIRTTDMLARLVEEVKWRTKVVEIFPNDRSVATLATAIALRSSEEWAIK
jgi:putative transposase